MRGILLVREGRLHSRNREEQRKRIEDLGIVPAGLGFKAMAAARNGVAHHCPNDPAKQAAAVNAVAAAVPLATAAFDALAQFVDTHLGGLDGRQDAR